MLVLSPQPTTIPVKVAIKPTNSLPPVRCSTRVPSVRRPSQWWASRLSTGPGRLVSLQLRVRSGMRVCTRRATAPASRATFSRRCVQAGIRVTLPTVRLREWQIRRRKRRSSRLRWTETGPEIPSSTVQGGSRPGVPVRNERDTRVAIATAREERQHGQRGGSPDGCRHGRRTKPPEVPAGDQKKRQERPLRQEPQRAQHSLAASGPGDARGSAPAPSNEVRRRIELRFEQPRPRRACRCRAPW
jgi:hypothetical protein